MAYLLRGELSVADEGHAQILDYDLICQALRNRRRRVISPRPRRHLRAALVRQARACLLALGSRAIVIAAEADDQPGWPDRAMLPRKFWRYDQADFPKNQRPAGSAREEVRIEFQPGHRRREPPC